MRREGLAHGGTRYSSVGKVTGVTVFLVHLPDGESGVVRDRVKQAYPGTASHEITPHWFLIRDDDISEAVAKKVGISTGHRDADADERTPGFVLKMASAYSGFYERSLWEWLQLTRPMNR